MERHYLNHMMKITGSKLDQKGHGFINFHYEGDIEDCVTVVIEIEKAAKKCLKKLSKKKDSL